MPLKTKIDRYLVNTGEGIPEISLKISINGLKIKREGGRDYTHKNRRFADEVYSLQVDGRWDAARQECLGRSTLKEASQRVGKAGISHISYQFLERPYVKTADLLRSLKFYPVS